MLTGNRDAKGTLVEAFVLRLRMCLNVSTMYIKLILKSPGGHVVRHLLRGYEGGGGGGVGHDHVPKNG